MTLRLGDDEIFNLYIGEDEIFNGYLGEDQVFDSSGVPTVEPDDAAHAHAITSPTLTLPPLAMVNLVAAVRNGTAGTTQTLSGVTVTANKLHLLCAVANNTAASALADPTVTQTGATWDKIASRTFAASNRKNISLWRCQPTGNVTANIDIVYPVSVSQKDAVVDQSNYSILRDTGNNGSAAVPQFKTNGITGGTSATPSATLDNALGASGNITYGVASEQGTGTFSETTGFDILSQVAGTAAGDQGLVSFFWDLAEGTPDLIVDVTYSGANLYGIIAVELAKL